MIKKSKQSEMSFEDMNTILWDYLVARDWHKNPAKGLAVSILLEAGELLEHYQWSDKPVGAKEELAEELADVLIYAFQFAQANNIDIAASMLKKLEKAGKKYPAEKFKGRQGNDSRSAWLEAKMNYQKEGL